MHLEIVSHCWRYWRCLTYQASGLFLHPPTVDHQVTLHVFIADEDGPTQRRVDQLAKLPWPANVQLQISRLPATNLFRRAIGRNLAALNTTADAVWFADCDYVIFGTSVGDVASVIRCTQEPFLFPKAVLELPRDRSEALIAQASTWTGPIDVPRDNLKARSYRRAIGGIQIVVGDVCRKLGYLDKCERWQRPARRWQRCFDDVAFRRHLTAKRVHAKGVAIRDVHRLMHQQRDKRDAQWER